LFAYSGLVAWTFFANAVTTSSNSLVGNTQLISKVYFPRLFIPLASIVALVVDMLLSLTLLGTMMAYYRWPVSPVLALAPVFIVGTILAASGIGLILSALNVRFRDVKYAAPFFVQMGLFATPIIYPLHYIPEQLQTLAALNPMAGMIEGFRHALLGTPVRWSLVSVSMAVTLGLFVLGLFVFRRTERRFADII
jgi:lipopolysaccharide transport system permease protein